MKRVQFKSKVRPLASAAAAFMLFAGCAHDEETTRGTVPYSGSEKTANDLTDGQIAAVLYTVNQTEVAIGMVAKTNATTDQVRQLASTIVNGLTDANNKLIALIQKDKLQTGESDTKKSLIDGSSDDINRVEAAKGTDFDKAYLTAVINQSKRVLILIDTELLPNEKNMTLAESMRQLRPKYAQYLMTAQDLEAQIVEPPPNGQS